MKTSAGFSLTGTLQDGKLTFDAPARYKAFARRLSKTCSRVTVTIEKYVKQRTLPQNAYLHAHPFPILAAHFGCSVTEVKRDLMGECWGWKVSPITGLQVPVREHTADLHVEDCNFFIDWLLPWALVEHGVELQPPDPEWMFNKTADTKGRAA